MNAAQEQAPMTAEQVHARLDGIAPWPGWGSEATPESVARWLAVHAQREWAAHILPFSAPGGPETLDVAAVAKMNGQFAAAHALLALADADPEKAQLAASQIADAWNDGGGTGEWLWDHLAALGVDAHEVSRLEAARRALPEVKAAAPGSLTASERDLIRADLGRLLEALGLGDYARPESPHEVMRQCIAEIAWFREGAGLLGRAVDGQVRAMEAARIEMRQNGPHAAMQWILNSLPDVWDDPGTAWDGEESAQAWFDRTEDAYQVHGPAAAPLRAPESIPLDIALAALTKLASEAPAAVNGAPEEDARRRLAARAIEDVEAVTGEARTEEGTQQ